MAREYRFITNKQVDKILDLYVAGRTYNDIAGEIDIDPSRVGQLARKAGLPLRSNSKPKSAKQLAYEQRRRNVQERATLQNGKRPV